ncbi:MAG: hypothetical protein QXN93_06350 [Methanomassiliicoccales archaeon]
MRFRALRPFAYHFLSLADTSLFGRLKGICIFIIVGLAVRLLIAPWTSCPYDIYPFYRGLIDILSGVGIYSHAYFSYPPLSILVISPSIAILSLFFDPINFGSFQPSMIEVSHVTGMLVPFVTHPLFNLFFKLPLIIADLVLGLSIYEFVKEKWNVTDARKAFILWFLNPLVIWVSSVAGQIDVLPAAMTLISMVYFYRRRYFFSGVALGLGVLFKVYPIYLFIFYFVFLLSVALNGSTIKSVLRKFCQCCSMICGGLVSGAILIPFFLASTNMLDFVFRRTGSTSYGGLNLWFFIPALPSEGLLPSVLPIVIDFPLLIFISIIVLAFVVSAIISRFYFNQDRDELIMLVTGNLAIIGLIMFLQPVTNPQHMLWLFPFLLILSASDARFERKFYLLTIVSLLYFIWLQTAFALIYPLVVYTPVGGIEVVNDLITRYYVTEGIFSRQTLVISSAMVGGLVILSVLMPKKYDFVDKLWDRLKIAWGHLP